MNRKSKLLYLSLAIICFIGIILIFIFDGYIGLYETLIADNGQYTQTIEAEQWEDGRDYGYIPGVSAEEGQSVDFTYTIENRHFSGYTDNIVVTYKATGLDTVPLIDTGIDLGAFSKQEIAWSLDTADIIPKDFPTDRQYMLIVTIKSGGREHDVNMYINRNPVILKY